MKITIGRTRLFDGLRKVQAGANAKSVCQIYANVKIETHQGGISLTTTDGDITLYSECDCTVVDEGAITIPIRKLLPTVSSLPEGDVTLSADGGKVRVVGGTFKANLNGISASEFPVIQKPDVVREFTVKASLLCGLIRSTAYARSNDETRRTLMGILVETGNGNIRCVATDGRRLAVSECECAGEDAVNRFIIPTKSVQVLQNYLKDDGDVTVRFYGSQVAFVLNDGKDIVHTKLVDGEYPNYATVIPNREMFVATIDRDSLVQVLERVSVIGAGIDDRVYMTFDDNMLRVKVTGEDSCDATDEIPMKYSGDKIDVIFNPKYVIDPLRISNVDSIEFHVANSTSPAMIKSNDEKFLYVIMPMRIS